MGGNHCQDTLDRVGSNPVIRFVPEEHAAPRSVATPLARKMEQGNAPTIIAQPRFAPIAPTRPGPTASRTFIPPGIGDPASDAIWLRDTTKRKRNSRRVHRPRTLGAFEKDLESNFCEVHSADHPPMILGHWQQLCCEPSAGPGGGFLTPKDPGIGRYIQQSQGTLPAVLGYWKVARPGPGDPG